MICSDFCAALVSNQSRIAAVAARSGGKAEAFRSAVGADSAYGSYAELFNDSEVDVVYIGTIHPTHYELALAAIEAGKGLVVEKPMCMTAAQTATLVDAARTNEVFLMEGMWTRFFPAVRRAAEIIEDGALIGKPVACQADFGFHLPWDPGHRNYDLEMGGGAALDIGCYTVQFATMAFGATLPDQVRGTGRLAPTGIDVDGAISMTWSSTGGGSGSNGGSSGGGGTATANFGMAGIYPEETLIMCERGYLKLGSPAHCPTKLEVFGKDPSDPRSTVLLEAFEEPLPPSQANNNGGAPPPLNFPNSEGMLYQVQHVESCLEQGLLESPAYGHAESLVVAHILEAFHHQVGVVYPDAITSIGAQGEEEAEEQHQQTAGDEVALEAATMVAAAAAEKERAAVQECIEKFSYAIDSRHDDTAEAIAEWATEDFAFHLAREGDGKGGPGPFDITMDRPTFSGFIGSLQQKYQATQHNNANTRITFTGPGTATATTYCQNWHQLPGDGKEGEGEGEGEGGGGGEGKEAPPGGGFFVFHGVYNDELVKTEAGEWRVKSRHQFPLFQQGAPSA
eukprot:g3869.t1